MVIKILNRLILFYQLTCCLFSHSGIPGILSDESPISPFKSINCLGVTLYFLIHHRLDNLLSQYLFAWFGNTYLDLIAGKL